MPTKVTLGLKEKRVAVLKTLFFLLLLGATSAGFLWFKISLVEVVRIKSEPLLLLEYAFRRAALPNIGKKTLQDVRNTPDI
jgi:hypothetical protein